VSILLVSGTTAAGLLIGAVLDPAGQRLADRSREEDDRRRAERQAVDDEQRLADGQRAADDESGPVAVPELDTRPVRHVLPSGRVPARTVAAGLVTGALFGAAAHHFGRDLVLAPFCVLFAMLVVVSVTDLTHRLVPRHLLYGALALIVPLLVASAAVDHQWHDVSGAAIAGAVSFGLFFAVWWFVPRGLGFGDVRLAGVIGLTVGYLSLLHAYVAFLAGFLIGLLFGVVVMVASSSGRKTRIPFAPSLAAGAVVAVFWGGHLAQSLFHAGS
jgi:prepilin signal peptidase PulO-like enzyme (type II secretory pathway)